MVIQCCSIRQMEDYSEQSRPEQVIMTSKHLRSSVWVFWNKSMDSAAGLPSHWDSGGRSNCIAWNPFKWILVNLKICPISIFWKSETSTVNSLDSYLLYSHVYDTDFISGIWQDEVSSVSGPADSDICVHTHSLEKSVALLVWLWADEIIKWRP